MIFCWFCHFVGKGIKYNEVLFVLYTDTPRNIKTFTYSVWQNMFGSEISTQHWKSINCAFNLLVWNLVINLSKWLCTKWDTVINWEVFELSNWMFCIVIVSELHRGYHTKTVWCFYVWKGIFFILGKGQITWRLIWLYFNLNMLRLHNVACF